MRNKRKSELFLDIVNLDGTTPDPDPPRQGKANKSINYMGRPPVKFIGTGRLGRSQDFDYGDSADRKAGSEGPLPVIGNRGLGDRSFEKSAPRGGSYALRVKPRVPSDFGPGLNNWEKLRIKASDKQCKEQFNLFNVNGG